jgi:nitroreductase
MGAGKNDYQSHCQEDFVSQHYDFLMSRRSVLARFMAEPGPDSETLDRILEAGLRVPDHGKLAPWRYIVFTGDARARVGDLIEAAFRRQNGEVRDQQAEIERTRFLRAPVVVAVVSRTDPHHPKVPEWEQLLSSGAVCMNILNAAHAFGFAAQWLTEWYAYDREFLAAIGVEENEKLAGYVYIGSMTDKPDERPRVTLDKVRTDWAGA